MLLNKLMEGDTITTKNLISSIKSFNTDEKEHGAIKALIKNFILPEKENMAIKDQMDNNNKYVYTIPVKPPTERAKTLFEAKQAFLNSTIAPNIPLRTEPLRRREVSNQEPTLHYAQIAITTEAEDTRSTGGGQEKIRKDIPKPLNIISSPITKRRCEGNPRKVSFKTKTASVSHRRPPIATKTMTISNSKVSELTRKFNNLGTESHNGSVLQSQIAKTIEELQSVARFPASDSSPSSTLSSSPNIKVVVRHRRSSKRRHNKKRCSSMDSIDKQISTDSKSPKIRVIRSKSDGTKSSKCKSPKKRLDYPDSSELKSSFDCVDGFNSSNDKKPEVKVESGNAVKNVIKKFECEITAQIQSTNTLKRQSDSPKSTTPIREKPKVPERKQSLVVTKNLVVKDGVPKIRTIKTVLPTDQKPNNSDTPNIVKRRESIYDRNKFKTNYIHTDKLPMKIVEIIQEDVNENNEILTENVESTPKVSDNVCQDVTPNITPNDSFLWRWKSSTQIYSDTEKSDCSYGVLFNDSTDSPSETKDISLTEEYTTNITVSDDVNDFQNNTNSINNSDFESSLVEAFNKDVLRGFTSKPKANPIENDYELLEPRDIENLVVIPIKTVEKPSRINCPLPEIPKECPKDIPPKSDKENIYQCLLEMRSHPEGDESSMHNYELCADDLEERTRGDGDSDDGYEYCKSPIKPYCLTSSSGIEIAENYKPYEGKNYGISKSVSGTSTVSYEKIGSERIYEKIPAHVLKSKESSPSQSSIHSMMSSDYNDTENIYDTIKHGDEASLSHCYESIPNSPSMVKMRNNLKKQLASAVQKRLSYDAMSNISQSTMSSEQKTNSIYGQRSMISYNGQEIAFQVPSSENSVSDRSDRSDRSDDWVDVSDDEKSKEQKIIILRERGRSRKSTISWSQKVRHQRHHTPKKKDGKDGDSSDSGHLYESLEPPPSPRAPPLPLDDDFDSFDSDTDTDDHDKISSTPPPLPASRLPSPPSGGPYTLTKIANAAQKKMRQLTRNLTKKYNTVAMDVKPFKSPQNQTNGTYDVAKTKKSPIYANYEKPESPVYTNVNFTDARNVFNKTAEEEKKKNGFREELKSVIGEKRLSNGEAPPLLPDREKVDKPTTPTSENSKKDSGTLSRKTYFSFKSRFRRASSIAMDINTDVPSALKITNSTFYLTDSMDGDSGFSNCSDGPASSSETLTAPARRSAGPRAELRARRWADSSPCLALERPGVPPPPPPPSNDSSAVHEELKRLLPTLSRKDKGPRTRTSWYAECGASDTASVRTSNTSWYAESGLYQVGNISTSSGASSGSHPASPLPHSLFTHEPLYQFYNAAKVESVCREGDSDSDAYDASPSASEPSAPPPRPSAMALVSPRGPARTLWCEVPEVVNSAVLSSLAPAQKRLQEAKFELLTSEASYLNSLNVLETNFASHPAFRDPSVLSRDDWETLFSDILPVRKCSALLMSELEKCWQESVLLQGICEAVRAHAERHFHVYVAYCERQAVMVRALQRLKEKPAFTAALKKLESHPACQALSLHSFLMLPMQRVTRLPLLLDAVLRALRPADPEYQPCLHALATLNCFVSQCNEGARNTERLEEMWRLTTRIVFPSGLRDPPALGPACGRRDRKAVRWLVRSGEMTQLVWKTDELKLTFGKKFHKVPLHLFLFNDLLVITKKKGEEQYVAVDYCARSLLEVCSRSEHAAARHALLLTLLDNHDHRTVEMLMSCASETDAQRWASALQPASSEGAECVYAGWDCPQVAAVFAHVPGQPDELALVEGDVLNVTRKTREGWFYGERTRDGEAGWFPGSYTVEIASAHVRARNLRQRYRLLALSATYLGQKKKVT